MENENKKTLLKIKHVDVKFRVRGRILSAIRDANLEIKENETIAIVGESGSGKSVLTKTFAGMLDSNGFISHGNVYFYDDDISYTETHLTGRNKMYQKRFIEKMKQYSYESVAAEEFLQIEKLQEEINHLKTLSQEALDDFDKREKELGDAINDTFNLRGTLDRKDEEEHRQFVDLGKKLAELRKARKALAKERIATIKATRIQYEHNAELKAKHKEELARLNALRDEKIAKAKEKPLTPEQEKIAVELANEILLSIGRYPFYLFYRYARELVHGFHLAYARGLRTDRLPRRISSDRIQRDQRPQADHR